VLPSALDQRKKDLGNFRPAFLAENAPRYCAEHLTMRLPFHPIRVKPDKLVELLPLALKNASGG
jgi:hypothetical protein